MYWINKNDITDEMTRKFQWRGTFQTIPHNMTETSRVLLGLTGLDFNLSVGRDATKCCILISIFKELQKMFAESLVCIQFSSMSDNLEDERARYSN